MTDKEPTQEQKEKFWKRCGGKFIDDFRGKGFIMPDASYYSLNELSDFTGIEILGLLFKYAVPKVLEKVGKLRLVALVNDAVCDVVENKGKIEDYLFWAIWEVIHGS